MRTAQRVIDALTRHSVDVRRYSSNTLRRMIAILSKAEKDISEQVQRNLSLVADGGGDLEPYTNQRLRALQERIGEINKAAHAEILSRLTADMVDLGSQEAEFAAGLYTSVGGINSEFGLLAPARIRAIVTAQPFQGRVLREWAQGMEANMLRRIKDAINIGLVEGQSTAQIVQRIRGSKAYGYRDGIVSMTVRGAEALVRTVTTHVQTKVHSDSIRQNASLYIGVRWVSVLDSRTTPVCQARDGELFPVESGPRPPAHWNCRSTVVGVLKGQNPTPKMTYGKWLRSQPRSVVEDVLGKTRAKLFLDGKLDVKDFVNRRGDELTIGELRARNTRLFAELGL